ncbi:MAG: amino acid ABC transporter permease [Chthoniobacteraceae bacterium]
MNVAGTSIPSRRWHAASYAVAILLPSFIIYLALWQLTSRAGWESVWNYRELFWRGWRGTIFIASGSLVFSIVIGLLLALGRRAPWLPVRAICIVHVELIRGTPLLAQILILYYGVFHLVRLENQIAASLLILSNFAGAYISEIIRAGIESVGRSQWESARAIGLTTAQTYRYVVLPQALRQALPPLAGQFASLIKDSSLLSIIGVEELTQNAQQVASFSFSYLESYLPLAIGYLVLTLPISLWTRWLERRHHFET